MSEKPEKGSAPITPQALDESLNALFSEEYDVETRQGASEAANAFINLVIIFASQTKWNPLCSSIRFDLARLESMLRRFHRDAFGVDKFCKFMQKLHKDKIVKDEVLNEIIRRVKRLSLRIVSDEPRKTKIVAAFALWFSALRPIYFEDVRKSGIDNETVNIFCASFALWVTENFLKKFGKIEWGNDMEDMDVRLERFKHDFTYRAINMSSYEFFYGGIFRAVTETKKD
jgi:hypothetical protein